MGARLVTAPEEDLVPLHDARDHLRVDHHAEDDLISGYSAAACDYAERYTGRAFLPQVWEEVLDGFPPRGGKPLYLSRSPLRAVLSIAYVDAGGVERTLDPGAYKVDTSSTPGRIAPAYGTWWPAARCEMASVRIRYEAGYDSGQVPESIRSAVLLILGKLYEQRSDVVTGTIVSQLGAAHALLDRHAVIWLA